MLSSQLFELLGSGKYQELHLAAQEQPLLWGENGSKESIGDVLDEPAFEALIRAALSQAQRDLLEREGSISVTRRESANTFRLTLFRRLGRLQMTVRPLPSKGSTLEELNLPSGVSRLIEFPDGLVLLGGLPDSGRSATVGALLEELNQTRKVRVATLEEQIHVVHVPKQAQLSQTEIGNDVPDAAMGIRALGLEQPSVIIIDSVNSSEVAQSALNWALAGKLVLAVVQGRDSVALIKRFSSFFGSDLRRQALAEMSMALRAVFCQRLVAGRGVNQRFPATEFLTMKKEVSEWLRHERFDEISDYLRGANRAEMFSFEQSLASLVRNDLVEQDLALALARDEAEFKRALGDGNQTRSVHWDLNSLLRLTYESGASDLHLSSNRPPIIRVGGELEKLSMPRLTSRNIRNLLYSCITTQQRAVFEKDKELDCSLEIDGGIRFRLNAFFQKGCVAIAFRTIPSRIPNAEELGIPDALIRIAKRPHGLVLTVGPTGSGKTTTVACLIDLINRTRPCHIITVEDPIEYSHDSLMATLDQREVYADTPSFASALKYVLRQDPDVIVVGEMRDLETISAVLTAAETGHLVFATLHTNDACQTVDRIVDVFPPHQQPQIRQQLAASLLAVVSQRLLPRADDSGRVAAFELLLANQAIRALIREGKTHQMQNVLATSSNIGMTTLDKSLARLFQRGIVAFEEAARFISDPALLRNPEFLHN